MPRLKREFRGKGPGGRNLDWVLHIAKTTKISEEERNARMGQHVLIIRKAINDTRKKLNEDLKGKKITQKKFDEKNERLKKWKKDVSEVLSKI